MDNRLSIEEKEADELERLNNLAEPLFLLYNEFVATFSILFNDMDMSDEDVDALVALFRSDCEMKHQLEMCLITRAIRNQLCKDAK